MWKYNTISSNELYHFGTKGMKWGVRKKKENSSDQNNSNNEYDSKKYKRVVNEDGAVFYVKKSMPTYKKVMIGAGVISAGYLAYKALSKKTVKEVTDNKISEETANKVKDIISNNKTVKLSDLAKKNNNLEALSKISTNVKNNNVPNKPAKSTSINDKVKPILPWENKTKSNKKVTNILKKTNKSKISSVSKDTEAFNKLMKDNKDLLNKTLNDLIKK